MEENTTLTEPKLPRLGYLADRLQLPAQIQVGELDGDFEGYPPGTPRNSWIAGLLKEASSKLMFKGGYIIQFLGGGLSWFYWSRSLNETGLLWFLCASQARARGEKQCICPKWAFLYSGHPYATEHGFDVQPKSTKKSTKSTCIWSAPSPPRQAYGPRQVISSSPPLPIVESGFPCTRAPALGWWSWWMNRMHAFWANKNNKNLYPNFLLGFHSGAISTSL